MLLISSPRFEDHITPPGHPERSERAHVFEAVAARWVQNGGRVGSPRPATRPELERAHDAAYIDALEATAGRAAMLDPDTFTSADSEAIARLAAGACVQAVEHTLAAHEPAFALVRPPGHHAERNRAMGFCLYNSIAVAAYAALDRGLQRVAIVDIDVHHGNGTQSTFYEDPRVLYLSTHQHPFYPGTGSADEVGRGAGRGFTVNVPMEAGCLDADYLAVHDSIVGPILDQFAPQLTLISAGYDAHERDPLASMRLTTAGYGIIMSRLRVIALRHGSLAAITEGGYDLAALAQCLEASLEALSQSGESQGTGTSGKPSTSDARRGNRAVELTRQAHTQFWSVL